ncbi:MAG: aminotransferase class III-fold pyridoxal phosphate-dependent enzyme [Dehalococcoidia bacterium]|nr:aminotransferase class III-fold pyridoxal phosphate-dependent enzyme [Dehalococcoidia bacterium]
MTIEERYIEAHPGSQSLYGRASAVLPSGVTHDARFQRPFPIYVNLAAGSRKWDVDGHELVDYVMGHGALLLGHSHPVVTEAAAEQVPRGSHYGASHDAEIRWAEQVVDLVPSAEAVRFTSSGTEATLMALRLARAASGRPAILKFDRHFHGWHDYVISSSNYDAAAPAGVPESTLDSVVVVAPEMHTVRETIAARQDIGTVIVEASGAAMGTVPLPEGFLRELRDYCDQQGLVMVMDEVVTGFRWAPGGVQERESVTPDLTALAKILAGGFPGGAVAGRRDLMEQLSFDAPGRKVDKVGHPGTFNANPVSAAAGAACLAHIADGQAQQTAEGTAHRLGAEMNAALAELGIPGAVYGQASILKILLGGETIPEARAYHPLQLDGEALRRGNNPETQRLLNLAMITNGVQVFGNGLIVSAVHSDDDIDRTLEAWRTSLAALREEGQLP